MQNTITAHVDIDRRNLGKGNDVAAHRVMNELAGKIMAHLLDGTQWVVQLGDFKHVDSVTNHTRRVFRTAGIAPISHLGPILMELNDVVREKRIAIKAWYEANPEGVYKHDEPKSVLVDDRLIIALLEALNFPIQVPKTPESNPQALS